MIAVVVPSLDQGRFLRQALSSLFDQEYPELEVVVMDGCSTDESAAIIAEYAPLLAYWRSRPDAGQAAAINEGVQHCTGELVAWLNADDFHLPDARHAHPDQAPAQRARRPIHFPPEAQRPPWGGNRTSSGAVMQQFVASMLRTCRQQGIDPCSIEDILASPMPPARVVPSLAPGP